MGVLAGVAGAGLEPASPSGTPVGGERWAANLASPNPPPANTIYATG